MNPKQWGHLYLKQSTWKSSSLDKKSRGIQELHRNCKGKWRGNQIKQQKWHLKEGDKQQGCSSAITINATKEDLCCIFHYKNCLFSMPETFTPAIWPRCNYPECALLYKRSLKQPEVYFSSLHMQDQTFLEQFLLLSKTTLKTHYNHTPEMGKMWKNWLALFCISILACQLCQQLILTFEKKLTVHYTSGLHKDHISELHDQINVRSIPFPKAPSLEVLLLVIL